MTAKNHNHYTYTTVPASTMTPCTMVLWPEDDEDYEKQIIWFVTNVKPGTVYSINLYCIPQEKKLNVECMPTDTFEKVNIKIPTDEEGIIMYLRSMAEAEEEGEEIEWDEVMEALHEMKQQGDDEDEDERLGEYQDEEDVRRHHP